MNPFKIFFLSLALAAASPAAAQYYGGNTVKPHGHTRNEDGGVLATVTMVGTLTAPNYSFNPASSTFTTNAMVISESPTALGVVNVASGTFILGKGTTVYKTFDGILYSSATAANFPRGTIAYGNGRFIAPYSATQMNYSLDGLIWSTATILSGYVGSGAYAYPLTFWHGKFWETSDVVVSSSTDGITWSTAAVLPDGTGNCYGIVSDNTRIITKCHENIFESADGINWTAHYWHRGDVGSEKILNGTVYWTDINSIISTKDFLTVTTSAVITPNGIHTYSICNNKIIAAGSTSANKYFTLPLNYTAASIWTTINTTLSKYWTAGACNNGINILGSRSNSTIGGFIRTGYPANPYEGKKTCVKNNFLGWYNEPTNPLDSYCQRPD